MGNQDGQGTPADNKARIVLLARQFRDVFRHPRQLELRRVWAGGEVGDRRVPFTVCDTLSTLSQVQTAARATIHVSVVTIDLAVQSAGNLVRTAAGQKPEQRVEDGGKGGIIGNEMEWTELLDRSQTSNRQ